MRKISKIVSYTVAKSSGVCPSWFFIVGSAPWANNRAQSCVRPFWAASWRGVNAHLSVALTHVLYLISRAAMSTCCTEEAEEKEGKGRFERKLGEGKTSVGEWLL